MSDHDDNVTIRVEAAVFYRVVDPVKTVVAIRDYGHGVLRIAQTTLRATLGQHELDDLLANQAAINELLGGRTLQTLAEVATEHNSTLVLPIPIDVLDAVRERVQPASGVNADGNAMPTPAKLASAVAH